MILEHCGSGFEGDRHFVEKILQVRNCTSFVHILIMFNELI